MAWAFSLSPPPVRRPHTKGGLRLGSDGSGARTGPGPGWPETLAGRVSTWDFPPPPSGPRWWPLLLLVLLGLPQGEAQGPMRRQRGGQAGTALSRASAPALRLRVQGRQSSCATQGQHAVDPQSAPGPSWPDRTVSEEGSMWRWGWSSARGVCGHHTCESGASASPV